MPFEVYFIFPNVLEFTYSELALDVSVDTAFLQGVKKFFRIGEEIKELVDPYFLMNFAGKEVHVFVKIIRILNHN